VEIDRRGIVMAQPELDAQLKFRIKEPLRAALERSAAEHGRSLNAEIVDRLQQSVDETPMKLSPASKALGAVITKALGNAGYSAGLYSSGHSEGADGWADSPYAYDQACRAVSMVLEAFRPPGSPSIHDWIEALPPRAVRRGMLEGKEEFLERIGTEAAGQVLEGIASEDIEHPIIKADKDIWRVKQLLGHLADRLKGKETSAKPLDRPKVEGDFA
jgi:plasmid stability protein